MGYKEELREQAKKRTRINFIGKMVLYIIGIAMIFVAINYLEVNKDNINQLGKPKPRIENQQHENK